MLNFEVMNAFRKALEADQAPSATIELPTGILNEVEVLPQSGCTSFEEHRHIYSVKFDTDYYGNVKVSVHVQWWPFSSMVRAIGAKFNSIQMQNALHWNAYNSEYVHLELNHPEQPGVTYTCILAHPDLKSLWVQLGHSVGSYPNPKEVAAEDIWAQLVSEGVLEL